MGDSDKASSAGTVRKKCLFMMKALIDVKKMTWCAIAVQKKDEMPR
jgi:hypothetical protein